MTTKIPTWTLGANDLNSVMRYGIIEYAGVAGAIVSKYPYTRMKTPQPGDPVYLKRYKELRRDLGHLGYKEEPDYIGCYDWGRIDRLNWFDEGDVHICMGGASVYLGKDAKNWKGYVSISGGPFELHQQSDLVPAGEVKAVSFWNFKDGEAKAHNGQNFMLARPVFELVLGQESLNNLLSSR